MNRQKLTGYLMLFLGVYLLLFIFFPSKKDEPQTTNNVGVLFQATKKDYSFGEPVKVTINNTSTGSILFTPQACPQEPLTVSYNNDKVSVATTHKCSADPVEIKPSATQTVSFDNWNNQLFSRTGDYKIAYNTIVNGEPKTYETMVNIHDSNWFGVAWDAIFYRPIYNTLIFITTLLPSHDLGWAIILLTILIRIILLIPNQRALEQQKKMQKIQPKLTEIQKKYEGDQKKIGEETMKLWKENKVNPLGSCLPILLQLPVLIGLYTAITHGLEFSSTYFLYEPLKNFNIEIISHYFFGLDLSIPNVLVLPILLGVLQFIQMKLSLQIAEKKKKQDKKDATGKELKLHEPAKKDANAMMGKTMTYFLPLLIAFMALGFPAGVSVYWGVSTLFGIGQQIWVNREKEV